VRPKRLGCHDLELAGARRTMVEERVDAKSGLMESAINLLSI
jgi:hypothetical protein